MQGNRLNPYYHKQRKGRRKRKKEEERKEAGTEKKKRKRNRQREGETAKEREGSHKVRRRTSEFYIDPKLQTIQMAGLQLLSPLQRETNKRFTRVPRRARNNTCKMSSRNGAQQILQVPPSVLQDSPVKTH